MSEEFQSRKNEVVLIRHSETPWSKEGRYAGLTDLSLSPEGEAAAAAAQGKLGRMHFDTVISSPLKRACQTAVLLSLDRFSTDQRAIERDYGAFEGMTTKEIRASRPGWNIWKDEIPNGEALAAMCERVDSLLMEIRSSQSKRTLIVSHAHYIRLFAARWLGFEPSYAQYFRLDTLGLAHLGWERETPVILKWNS